MFIVKILYSIFFICLGIALLKYRRAVKGWTGNFLWAEKYLGNGGTYIVLILLGLFFIFLGVLRPFGGFEVIFGPNEHIVNNSF